ncbi:MAG: HAD-IC family P-type ATPase, partial [Clostridia bacterium]|nr:HAD-IC family P-type ATPase [Clostridia bacterium]
MFVFDKTGTLTKGSFSVGEVHPAAERDAVLRLAAIAEEHSSHPIARSICEVWTGDVEEGYVLTNLSGLGVRAERAGDVILCGNERLMRESGIALPEDGNALLGTAVYVAHNGVYVGRISITDEARSESREVLSALRASGSETVMLTGDRAEVAERVASELGISAYRASLLPQDKVREVEKRLAEKGKGDVLCFIGDGINDAPVLILSDVGVAMGGVGSDAAIEAADVVRMKDDLCGLLTAQRIAKEAMRTLRQNV